MSNCKITALICEENPFVDYFQPLLYDKEKISISTFGYSADMILPPALCDKYTTDDIQAYSPRVSRWCLLMFLVESFKSTEAHVRSQCFIDEEEFPNLELVPYNRFCQMLGWAEINNLLNDYFWGSDDKVGRDSDYVVNNYIPNLKRAFKCNQYTMFRYLNEPFEYSLNAVTLKDGRFPNGGMIVKISSDVI